MSEEIEYIEHSARVKEVNPAKSSVTVSIIEEADCGGCPASKLCSNFSPDKNILEVAVSNPQAFEKGDFVIIRGTEHLHRKAILLATVIPTIALIVVMIGVYLLTMSQLAACMSGLGSMVIFFGGLYLMRNKLAHEFTFQIFKQPSKNAMNKENINES